MPILIATIKTFLRDKVKVYRNINQQQPNFELCHFFIWRAVLSNGITIFIGIHWLPYSAFWNASIESRKILITVSAITAIMIHGLSAGRSEDTTQILKPEDTRRWWIKWCLPLSFIIRTWHQKNGTLSSIKPRISRLQHT